jgi:hypothetical protein
MKDSVHRENSKEKPTARETYGRERERAEREVESRFDG